MNTKNQAKPSIIYEGAIFDLPEKWKTYDDGHVTAVCYLQTADEKNQNRRVYPKSVLDQGMKAIQEKINDRRFLGELDHPISDNQTRQCTVEFKNASHLIREWWWEGNRIKGVLETLNTPSGNILKSIILQRIPAGYSLRGLADVNDCGGAQYVQAPLIVISYDAVTEPSHKGSLTKEIREEGKCFTLNEGHEGLKILQEARNFYTLSNNRTYTANALDYLVENKIVKLMKKFTMV